MLESPATESCRWGNKRQPRSEKNRPGLTISGRLQKFLAASTGRSGRFPKPELSKLMGLDDPLGILANLLADTDHHLFNADAIDLQIPIIRAGCGAVRNVEDAARSFKQVRMIRWPDPMRGI